MPENINFLPFSYESLLFQLISQIGKAKGGVIDSEVAKAIYPLIYDMANGKKDISKRDIKILEKQLPKEFKIALKAIKSEHFEKKTQNEHVSSKNPKLEKKEEGKVFKTFSEKFDKNLKNEKKETKEQKNSNLEKREKKSNFSLKKLEVKDPFKTIEKKESNLKEPQKDIGKPKKENLEKKEEFKSENFLKKTEDRGFSKMLKVLKNFTSKKIFSKILDQDSKSNLSIIKNIDPQFKSTTSLSRPFVNFHWKEKRDKREELKKSKYKLRKVERKDLDKENKNKK